VIPLEHRHFSFFFRSSNVQNMDAVRKDLPNKNVVLQKKMKWSKLGDEQYSSEQTFQKHFPASKHSKVQSAQ